MVEHVTDAQKGLRPRGHYSLAVVSKPLVFVSSQVGRNPETSQMLDGIEGQTRQALLNVKAILEAAKCTLEDVVQVRVFLAHRNDFAKMNEVYETFFPKNPPVRTTVETSDTENVLVTIEAVAYKE